MTDHQQECGAVVRKVVWLLPHLSWSDAYSLARHFSWSDTPPGQIPIPWSDSSLVRRPLSQKPLLVSDTSPESHCFEEEGGNVPHMGCSMFIVLRGECSKIMSPWELFKGILGWGCACHSVVGSDNGNL